MLCHTWHKLIRGKRGAAGDHFDEGEDPPTLCVPFPAAKSRRPG